jgi:SPP1 family predicted phage head-tail adaptor
MKRIRIGDLDKDVTFYSPNEVDNGRGGKAKGWTEEFNAMAKFTYLRGSEISLAGRLSGKQPVVMTVHNSPRHYLIAADWMVKFDGVEYNVRENTTLTEGNAYLQFLTESGVSTGSPAPGV